MPGGHALLSPSSASRWLYCTRAPRLEERFPESTSRAAEEGTLAHAIAEVKARAYFFDTPGDTDWRYELRTLRESPLYKSEMDRATDEYLDYLKSVTINLDSVYTVMLETQVRYEQYAPGGFGRADCLIWAPPTLYVVDYKNGAGVPVAPVENPQMMLYALGALDTYSAIYGKSIKDVSLTIVQPNAGGVKEWSITRTELEQWGATVVKPAAALAYAGEGQFAPSEDRCRFCRAKERCSARRNHYLGLEAYSGKEPDLLTDKEIGSALTRAKGLKAWVSDLESYALKKMLSGGIIPGYKVVEGRKSRDWVGCADTAFQELEKRGIEKALLWERKPVTPAALQKALGKKVYDESVADLVLSKPGKPVLALESDKKPAYNSPEAAFEVIQNE